MYYKISLKALKKLANPFEQPFIDGKTFITIKEVESQLNSEIQPLESSVKSTYIQQFKEAIISQEPKETIIVDLGAIEKDGWLITSGISELAAAIYHKVETIEVKILGDEKAINMLLGKVEKLNNPTVKIKKELMWDIEATPPNNQKIMDKLYQIIQSSPSLKKEDINNLIPEEKWKEPEFLELFLSNSSGIFYYNTYSNKKEHLFQFLTDEVIASTTFWDVIKKCKADNNIRLLETLMSERLKNIYDEKEMEQSRREKLLDNINTIFWNESFAEYITRNENESIPYIPPEYLKKQKVIDNLINLIEREKLTIENFIEFMPHEIYENSSLTLSLIKGATCYQQNQILKSYPQLYESWFSNIKEVKNFVIKTYDLSGDFYNLLPDNIKNDNELIKVLLNKNEDMFAQLSPEKQQEEEIFLSYIVIASSIRSQAKRVFNIKDKEVIKKIITNNPEIMIEKTTPIEWRQDPELIACMGKQFSYGYNELSKVGLQKLYQREDLLKNLINSYNNNYSKFPIAVKIKTDIAIEYIKSSHHSELLNYLPESIWLNKKVCLEALNTNSVLMRNMPVSHFNNKDFILELFNKIDNQKISKEVFNYLPMKIQSFLDHHGVRENYHAFLSSYFMNKELNIALDTKTEHSPKRKL